MLIDIKKTQDRRGINEKNIVAPKGITVGNKGENRSTSVRKKKLLLGKSNLISDVKEEGGLP